MSGLNYQATYVWSKATSSCSNEQCTSWIDVLNRRLDRGLQGSDRRHEFRVNGAWELPFGPNRLVLGSSSGLVARLVEQWQLSWIVNMTSGAPLNLTSTNTYIGRQRPQLVGEFAKDQGEARMTAGLPNYFDAGTYRTMADPQCAGVTTLQNLQTACTLGALADSQGRILLQTPVPGTLGNLGDGWITGPGSFRFDMSASKTVNIDETKRLEFRIDARNVLNHPILGNPNLDIGSANFGQIAADGVTGTRNFQALLRLSF
jgi:hypothetical protein